MIGASSMSRLRRAATALSLLVAAAGLSACDGPIKAALTGEGSMRISVDVYKGPLGYDPEIQWAQLLGYMREANVSIDHYIEAVMHVLRARTHELFPKPEEYRPAQVCKYRDTDALYGKLSAPEFIGNPNPAQKSALEEGFHGSTLLTQLLWDSCEVWVITWNTHARAAAWTESYQKFIGATQAKLRTLRENTSNRFVVDRNNKYQRYHDKLVKNLLNDNAVQQSLGKINLDAAKLRRALYGILGNFSEVGARFKAKAAFWAYQHASDAPEEERIRQLIATFQLLTAEYANRILSASDALLKQTYMGERREMPISTLLRDTNTTGFTNLLVFNRATNGPLSHEELFSHYRHDRVRVIERLYNDDSWSNINQAYASGQGDVRMAFIKDEIGNWNLKNFDNDPTELLQTYKGVGLAALKSAADLASSASGVGGAQKLIGLANQVSMGAGGGAGAAGVPEQKHLTLMRQSIVASLQRIKKVKAARFDSLTKERDSLDAQVTKQTDMTKAAKAEVDATIRNSGGVLREVPAEEARVRGLIRAQDAEKLAATGDAAGADAARNQAEQWSSLAKQIEARDKAIAELAEVTAKRDAARKSLADLPVEARAEVRAVLDGHRSVLDVLESSATVSASPASGLGDAAAAAGSVAR